MKQPMIILLQWILQVNILKYIVCIIFKIVIQNSIVTILCLVDILDNFIHESFDMNKDNKNTVNIWEEMGIDTPARIQDLEDVDNKIISVKKCC